MIFFVSLTKDFTEVKGDGSNCGITESLPVISQESVAKKLEGLNVRKAPGRSDPNAKLLKLFAKDFAIPITNI